MEKSKFTNIIVTTARIIIGQKGILLFFVSFDRKPGHKGVAGLIFGMVSMLIGDAVLLFQPVLDAWYYGAAFIIIASVLITLINVIRAFNVLTTRKLPQFATHKGGDDRA